MSNVIAQRDVETAAGARGAAPILTGYVETPLGPLLIGTTAEGVCLAEFAEGRRAEDQTAALCRLFDAGVTPGENEHTGCLRDELAQYFAGRLTAFRVPLVYPGNAFERAVWDALRQIPYGHTRAYEELARALGRPGAARAVGTANGRNRISIVIPCHRVVNKNGRLGGYGGGLWRKQALLDLERRVAGPTGAPPRAAILF